MNQPKISKKVLFWNFAGLITWLAALVIGLWMITNGINDWVGDRNSALISLVLGSIFTLFGLFCSFILVFKISYILRRKRIANN